MPKSDITKDNQGLTANRRSPSRKTHKAACTSQLGSERWRLLEAALASSSDGVIIFDAAGQQVYINEAGRNLLPNGVTGDQQTAPLRPMNLLNTHGQPLTLEETPLYHALRGKTVHDLLVRLPREDNSDLYLCNTASPIRDEQHRVIGAIITFREATRPRCAQLRCSFQDFIQSEQQAQQQTDEISDPEYRDLESLKEEFIAIAAHELKTPVTIMKGYAQMLLRDANCLSQQQREMLEAIDMGADRITRIVKDLLDISKLQLGQLELTPEKVDLAALVKEIVERWQPLLSQHQLRLLQAEPANVLTDRERLKQALSSLIDNAVKHSPLGGDIELTVSRQNDEAIVAVHDHGVGIPQSKQKHIFQRFYRAHQGSPHDYGGIGISLFMTKELIERHGGVMWFESEEGQGSTFYFSLPLSDKEGTSGKSG